jgi:hypothetical protein
VPVAAVFFNLLANGTFSLLCGLIVVGLFIWLFRVGTDRSRLFLLSLPYIKIVYDLIRGVPQGSVLFSGVNPLLLPGGNQTFSIGAGVSDWSVFMNAVFTVKDLSGKAYAASAGDYLLILTEQKLGAEAPLIIVSGVLSVSSFLIFRRLVKGISFELERRKDRQSCEAIASIALGWRKVDVYRSTLHSGSPFTGGFIKPYICLPADADSRITDEERNAIIAHELGHIRNADLITTILIQTLGDLFWFVPGYRWLSRKIDRLREVLADQYAIQNGVDASVLASVLLKLKEIPATHQQPILYSAFFRERSLLKERVERLVGVKTDRGPRFGWANRWIRLAVSLSAIGAVINSTFGGNRETVLFEMPSWFIHLMQRLGL